MSTKGKHLRLILPDELYDRLKKHADRYGNGVTPFIRQILVDRLDQIDAIDSTAELLPILKKMEKEGVLDELAGKRKGNFSDSG